MSMDTYLEMIEQKTASDEIASSPLVAPSINWGDVDDYFSLAPGITFSNGFSNGFNSCNSNFTFPEMPELDLKPSKSVDPIKTSPSKTIPKKRKMKELILRPFESSFSTEMTIQTLRQIFANSARYN